LIDSSVVTMSMPCGFLRFAHIDGLIPAGPGGVCAAAEDPPRRVPHPVA
jgi:hypothetical protein